MKWTALALLLIAATVWAYAPTPVTPSAAETNLKTALGKADTDAAKAKVATEFLDSHPTDIPAARLAQDAILKTLEDGTAFFKSRAEKSESIVDHYLYGRASGDSTIMAEQAAWIIKKDPKNSWGHLLAGTAEWEKAKPDNAVVEKHFKEAIDLDPSRPEGYLNLGYLYEDMENWPAAREAFEAGAVCDPANTSMRDARLTAYATLHDGDAYFKLIDGVLPQAPLIGSLEKANNGAGSVDMAQALKGKVTVIEYWAYT